MGVAVLFTWIATIEYDPEFQSAAATHLPVPVLSLHAVLGLSGLMLWVAHLLLDRQ